MSKELGDLHLIQELNIFQDYFSKHSDFSYFPYIGEFDHSKSVNLKLAETVAEIIDNGINGVVPNWIALKNELFKNKKNKIPIHPLSKDFSFSPKLISNILVRHKKTKLELFEKYRLVFIPGFDNYIVTLHSKNPQSNLITHFAIGTANGFMAPKKAAIKIVSQFNRICIREKNLKTKLMHLESGLIDFEEMDSCHS